MLIANMEKVNLLVNGSFERWFLGTTAVTADGQVNEGWYFDEGSGSTDSLTRDSANEETPGQYSLANARTVASGASFLYQIVSSRILEMLFGRVVSFQVRIKADAERAARPFYSLDGGTTKVYGEYNLKDITGYQTLKIDGISVAAGSTGLMVGVSYEAVETSYVDNATLVFGSASADAGDVLDLDVFESISPFPLGTSVLHETANNTLDSDLDFGYIHTSVLDGIVYTLPSTVVANVYTIMNMAEDGMAAVNISPAAADKIMGIGITSADNKDLINTKATAKRGDFVTLVGDGVDGWKVVAARGTWAREA